MPWLHDNCTGASDWQFPFPDSSEPCTYADSMRIQIRGDNFTKQNAMSGQGSGFIWLFSIFQIEFFFFHERAILQIDGQPSTYEYDDGNHKKTSGVSEYNCKERKHDTCYGCKPEELTNPIPNSTTTYSTAASDGNTLLYEMIPFACQRRCTSCLLKPDFSDYECKNSIVYNPRLKSYAVKPLFQQTCSVQSVNGTVEDPRNQFDPWFQGPSRYCRYNSVGQWQSKALYNGSDNDRRKVDIICHYSFQIVPKKFTAIDNDVKRWETDMLTKSNTQSGISFQSDDRFRQMVKFYMYIFWWVDLYYAVLYELPNEEKIYPYTANPSYINSVMRYLPSDFDQTQKNLNDLREFLTNLLILPVPKYDPLTNTYRIRIRMSYRLFDKAVLNQQKKSAIDSNISKYMNSFLEEDSIYIYKKGAVQPQILSFYTIAPNTIHCYQMVPDARAYKTSSIQNSENPLPAPFAGFNDWYNTAQPDDIYNPVIRTFPFLQNVYDIPFVACIELDLVIQKWSAPLVAIMKPVLNTSINFCNTLFQETNVYPINCSQNPSDVTSYKQFVDNACNTQITTQSVAILSIITQNLAYDGSLSTTCSCYYSGLMPPNLLTFANPAAMCFDRNCTDSDRKFVNATQQFCKDNCGTVYNWMYSKDQTISQNPSALDTARFQQLCGFRNTAINWNVLGNGIGIVVLITVVLIIWKRYWACLYVSVPILAVVIFLAYDLKLRSLCDADVLAPDKSFVCQTAITKIPMFTSYCDYIACECIFNEQCPYTCTCASGKCVPQIQGYTTMTTTPKETVQWNVMGSLFVLVLFIFCVLIRQKIPSVVGKGIWLVSSLIVLIVAIYFLVIRIYKYCVYDGSCIIPAPWYCGSQPSTTRMITLDAPADVPRYNVLLASVVSQKNNLQFIMGNVLDPVQSNISFYIFDLLPTEEQEETSMYYAVPSLGNTLSLGPYGALGSSQVEWSSSSTSLIVQFKTPFKSVPVVIGTPYYLEDAGRQIQFVGFQLLQVTQYLFECCLVDDKGHPQTMETSFSWVAIGETSSPEEQFFEVHQTRSITSRFTTTALTKPPALGCIANSYTSTFVAIPLINSLTNTGIVFSCAFRDETSSSSVWNYDLNDAMFSQNISFVYFIC